MQIPSAHAEDREPVIAVVPVRQAGRPGIEYSLVGNRAAGAVLVVGSRAVVTGMAEIPLEMSIPDLCHLTVRHRHRGVGCSGVCGREHCLALRIGPRTCLRQRWKSRSG
jgi:hypothetical protein